MAANPEHHVDVSALQDLKEIMEGEFEMLINTFVADSLAKIEELKTAIANQDSDALRKVAHSLKGSSSNICAGNLSELARQLEFMGKEDKIDGADGVLQQLREEFTKVKSVLESNL